MLILPGGLEINRFLSQDGEPQAGVAAAIRSFYATGRLIGAPGLAIGIVMNVLSDKLATLGVDKPVVHSASLSYFPSLHVLTTTRPLLGLTPERLHLAMVEFLMAAADLARRTDGGSSPNAIA
jgi:hypothetical protein